MLPRQLHLPAAGDDLAQWCQVSYIDSALTRREILRTSGASDAYHDWEERTSPDDGRTWSDPRPIPGVVDQRPDGGIVTYPCGHHYDDALGILYEKRMRRIWPGLEVYTFHWGSQQHPFNDHTFVVEDGRDVLLRFEEGPDYDPENPFDPEFCGTNSSYLGVGMTFAEDGTAYYPLVCRPAEHSHNTGGLVLMRRDPGSGDWSPSNQQFVDPDISSRGLLEPDVALLKNGHLLVVMRGSDSPTTPGRKWFSVSTDSGKTLSPVEEFRYDDGSSFYSPSSIHSLIRSHKNGRLYWIANITEEPPSGNAPRYPLYIAEIDEGKVAVRRDSLVLIDDRRAEEPDAVQLSNFSVIENRQTLDIEIYLTRIGEVPDHFWQGAVYQYTFTPQV
jgi:hypothetical protein